MRKMRSTVDGALKRMETVLAKMYADRGRPSIAPERLLGAQLLMVLCSSRSGRQLMEQLNFNLPYQWFAGPEMDDLVRETNIFSKNRERPIAAEVNRQSLLAVVEEAREAGLLSEEHFKLVEKSFGWMKRWSGTGCVR
ncbi:MAG: transposase [Terracidiphilus sp.]